MTAHNIVDASESNDHIPIVRELFREYAAELGVNLNFQGFEEELVRLPGRYASPTGCLLLARDGDEVLGCIALRQLGEGLGEVKRMYVRSAYRGRRIARALIERLMEFAVNAGYTHLRLDTLESMTAARSLYEGLGFERIAPYYHNPIPNVAYYEVQLKCPHEPGADQPPASGVA